jgi:hypothetical protein
LGSNKAASTQRDFTPLGPAALPPSDSFFSWQLDFLMLC